MAQMLDDRPPLRLYRGLALAPDSARDVIAEISEHGLVPGRSRMVVLWERAPAVEVHAACACSDFESAAFYACVKAAGPGLDHPLVVEFEAEPANVHVDGRDALYTVFGRTPSVPRARQFVTEAYGPYASAAFDETLSMPDAHDRLALCDSVVSDLRVVEWHAGNRSVVAGRWGTVFRTAFKVRLPVPRSAIRAFTSPATYSGLPAPTYVLPDLLRHSYP